MTTAQLATTPESSFRITTTFIENRPQPAETNVVPPLAEQHAKSPIFQHFGCRVEHFGRA